MDGLEDHKLKQLVDALADYLNSDYTQYCGYEMSKSEAQIAFDYLRGIPIVKPNNHPDENIDNLCGMCEGKIEESFMFCPWCGVSIDWSGEDGNSI